MKKHVELLIIIVLELFLSLGGIITGILLILDPSGAIIGLEPALPYIPFLPDFFLVGLWLLVVFDIIPLVISAGLWFQYKLAWLAALVLSIVILVWIAIQLILIAHLGLNILQIIIPAVAIVTIILLFRQKMLNDHFKNGKILIPVLNI